MSMAPVVTKHPSSDSEGEHESRRKKKRSRWGGDEVTEKAVIPGMPTVIPITNMTKDQEKAYLTQLRIEEITRMLRTGELGIPPPEKRSPSPEPQYDNQGKRLNTREVRIRTKLENERHKLVTEMLKLNPEYKPPSDYKAQPTKIVDKVFIPQEEHPEINFVGLLIGPRGNTLKNLERDTSAKIIIRGKGSIKEGKLPRPNNQPLPGEDEPLHAYITGSSVEIVQKACEKVREIVKQGIDTPECMNDLRKNQLRELALLNGTLRENDALNKLKLITQAQTIITNTIICSICGGAGHITSDCKLKKEGAGGCSGDADGARSEQQKPTWAEREKMDNEYQSLMAELGHGQAPDLSKPSRCIINPNGSNSNISSAATLAIEHNHSSNNLSPAYNESSQSPRSSNGTGGGNSSPAPSQPPPTAITATGVVEKVIDGRKVIDFTEVPRQIVNNNNNSNNPHHHRNQHNNPHRNHHRNHQPIFTGFGTTTGSAASVSGGGGVDYDPTQSMTNAAMMYSQQMNYYSQYGMPVWPGSYPMWPPTAAAAPPPPPPPPSDSTTSGGAAPPPPPPPPPPPS